MRNEEVKVLRRNNNYIKINLEVRKTLFMMMILLTQIKLIRLKTIMMIAVIREVPVVKLKSLIIRTKTR